jgi:hypothetical protein
MTSIHSIGIRYVGVIWVVFHVLQLLLIGFIEQKNYATLEIYNETSTKTILKFESPLIWLWLFELHVCSFLDWIDPPNCVLY